MTVESLNTAPAKVARHSWGDPVRFFYKTERQCEVCGLVKVTRHEFDRHWIEYWFDGVRVSGDKMPACEDA